MALLLPWVAGCSPPTTPPPTREVRIAAAADLKFAMDDIITHFAKQHPDITITTTYGSSGTLFAQLSNKAPFDLFLSADVEYPRRLSEAGLTATGTEFEYAIGYLVVWVPNGSPLDVQKDGIRVLLDPSARKIAIANPKHAPYGRAAEAAMNSLGVYDAVQDRLVLGENIAQAAQFVETGSADVGVIALSLAMSPPMREKGRYGSVPLDSYPRLKQGGVILAWAADNDAANTVREFLIGAEGKAILARSGFTLPKE